MPSIKHGSADPAFALGMHVAKSTRFDFALDAMHMVPWMDEILHHQGNPAKSVFPCKYQQTMVSHAFMLRLMDFVCKYQQAMVSHAKVVRFLDFATIHSITSFCSKCRAFFRDVDLRSPQELIDRI